MSYTGPGHAHTPGMPSKAAWASDQEAPPVHKEGLELHKDHCTYGLPTSPC